MYIANFLRFRTLVTRGQDMSARKSIQFFHNCSSTEQIEESLKEIKTNMKLNAKSVSMLKIWKEKGPNRRGTAVGCGNCGLIIKSCSDNLAQFEVYE